MRGWRSVASQRAKGRRRDDAAEATLATAYRDVFLRDDESVELVLADLADFCGFYKVAPPGTEPGQLQYDAGMRAAFGRLFHFLALTDDKLWALERAARAENETNETEGWL